MLREIDGQLAERAPAKAFASGMCTIAALQPGRALAARVICLVGMNDSDWPRPTPPLSLDLIAKYPRQGDFNRRGEERYAFLEAVLCAEEVLLVTYTGNDARSNVEYPPAAPLAELIDTLCAMTGEKPSGLVVRHPLQPFSASYFDGSVPQRYSYDGEHCPPSSVRAVSPFLVAGSLPELADTPGVTLERLQRFYAHPVRFHLREQLGIHLEESEELLEIHEPFVASKLDSYHLREAFFAACKDDLPVEETVRRLRARGWLPHGVAGELAAMSAHAEALPLWQAAHPWAEATPLPPCEATFAAGQTTLTGRLDGLTADGLWRVRYGKTRPEDLLRLWLDHLLLQIAAPGEMKCQSVLVAHDGITQLPPQANAAEILTDLLDAFQQGLQAPLPFYPKTAWAWLERKASWRNAWVGLRYQKVPGEQDDPYVQLAWRDRTDDPLGSAFQEMAGRIFGPLRVALESAIGKVGDD
jgi:exodeoxyribonuclease V gamma subunit